MRIPSTLTPCCLTRRSSCLSWLAVRIPPSRTHVAYQGGSPPWQTIMVRSPPCLTHPLGSLPPETRVVRCDMYQVCGLPTWMITCSFYQGPAVTFYRFKVLVSSVTGGDAVEYTLSGIGCFRQVWLCVVLPTIGSAPYCLFGLCGIPHGRLSAWTCPMTFSPDEARSIP